MDPSVLHFVVVAIWFGVLGTEFVLELLPLRRPELRPAAVEFHFWIDLILELPLLLAVLITGGYLATHRPMDLRLAVKLTAALMAIGANLFCFAVVVVRHRASPEKAAELTHLVHASGLGVPAGLVALYIGLGYAGWI